MADTQSSSSIDRAPPLRILAADPGIAEARALIGELDAYQEGLYPAQSNHLVPVDALRASNVVFLMAWLGPRAAGCAALLEQDGVYGEIKRMYVRPALRGQGVGGALLRELVSQARGRRLVSLRLETGIHQPEALALYERAGFARRGPFGDYREDPLSLFMELDLR